MHLCQLGVLAVEIGDELLDTGQEVRHDHGLLHGLVQPHAEVLHFVRRGSAHLGFAVLQKGLEGGNLRNKTQFFMLFNI